MKFWRLIWNLLKAWWNYREEARQENEKITQEVGDEIAQVESAIHHSDDDALAEYFRTGKLPATDGEPPTSGGSSDVG